MGFFKKKPESEKNAVPLNKDADIPALNAHSNAVDVNKPVENPRLKDLFNQFAKDKSDDIVQNLFSEIAERAHFLSVMMLTDEPEPNGDGTATFTKGTTMQFPMLTSRDGQSFYPVFTDWIELGKWQGIESPKTLILSFDDYADMVLQNENTHGIVINPFGDNFLINRDLMRHLKSVKEIKTKGVTRQTVTKNTDVLLGEPKNYPTEMVNAVTAHLKNKPSVNRAWLRLMQKDGEFSFLLVADFSGDRDTVFRDIAGAASPHLNGMFLDMIPYEDGFGKNAVEGVDPFYRK